MTCLRTTILLIALLAAAVPAIAQAQQGNLENPAVGAIESGISVISGWHCTASNISIQIDGVSLGRAGSGTQRPDTANVCGRTDTGFALLYNWNNLAEGSHVVNMYADDLLFDTRSITTVQSAAGKFVRGLSRSTEVSGFPNADELTTLQWSEAKQSFVVAKRAPLVVALTPGSPAGLTAVAGNKTITITFVPPSSNGGAAIDSYRATCGGTVVVSSAPSILITGLTNGITYACTGEVHNSAGWGAAATANSVAPAAVASGGSSSTTVTGWPTLSLSMIDAATQAATSSVSTDSSAEITAVVRDGVGKPVSGALVVFEIGNGTLATLTPSSGAVLTDANGRAVVRIDAANFNSVGATTVRASAEVPFGSTTVTASSSWNFSVRPPTVTLSGMSANLPAGATSLSPFATTSITVNVGGVPYSTAVNIEFSSTCVNSLKASITRIVSSVNGVATATYADLGCGATDTITARVSGTASTASTATISLVVRSP